MGLFFLPQMAQMDTDLYSMNTNTCIIRGIRVEMNNPQNSDGIQTEENSLLSVLSVGYFFGDKDTYFESSRFPSHRREIIINKFTINNNF